MLDDETEEWRAIPGHLGYEASTLGRIRSLDRVTTSARGFTVRRKGRILRPGISEGYPFVGLGRNKIIKSHILVALTFLGPRPPGMYACHKDDDRGNPKLSNIKYQTPKQNQKDRLRAGTDHRGEKHASSKLTMNDVNEIRRRLDLGEKQKVLAEEFNTCQPNISQIKHKVTWWYPDAEDH